METALKMAGRSIRVTKEMTEDAKKLVRLMGVPVVEVGLEGIIILKAPGEAEAQCSKMSESGVVYGTVSEDMDSLTFGSKILLRGFNSKKDPIS